ncbi:protein kinase domain-containing protein [Streptomyces beigongshangae]|uniref:protein kinase domain-containing protein n=1 Tax=Streptomyces beigongshangae TaxID=2841597 RepID=UPI001C84FFA5|nr:protein kinase [Streptomyces sp. REN17]
MGRYRLLGRLGSGGMGSVYLGRTPGGRPAAVKVINAHLQYDPAALGRFRREVETLGTIRNAFTAALIDAEVTNPPFWMATEYVPGPTLAGAVEASGPFPADLARAVLAALAEGLADVHVHNVLHRDIKPQNVILSATGPQLIDFGIARGEEMSHLTQVGTAIGTPGFIAPETLTRSEAGPASDVFALGVTMAYCLTGRPPYGQGSPATLSYRTVHEEMDLGGVPAEMARLIAACAHRDPARRPEPHRIVELCDSETDIVRHPAYQRIIAMASSADTAATPAPAASTPPPTPTPTVADSAPPVDPAAATAVQTRFMPSAPPPRPPSRNDPAAASAHGTGPARFRRKPFVVVGAVVAVAVAAATVVALEGSGSDAEAKDPRASVSRDASRGSTADDGNRRKGGKPAAALPQSLEVKPRRVLETGEFVQAAHVKLVMQEDGNLVSYDENDRPRWATRTSGANYRAIFQEDGNLVVHNAEDKPVWASNTGSAEGGVLELRADGDVVITRNGQDVFRTSTDPEAPQSLKVEPRRVLEAGEFVQAAHVKLVMREDGNLVSYDENNRIRWESRTSGANYRAIFQEDGNLVVHNAEDKPVWASNTGSAEGGVLELRADGDVAITRNGQDVFRTSTADRSR